MALVLMPYFIAAAAVFAVALITRDHATPQSGSASDRGESCDFI